MRFLIYLAIPLLIFFFTSCKKENSPSLLLIEPSAIELTMNSGEIQQFKIHGSSNTILKSFKITSKEVNTFTQVIFDTALITESFVMTYEYQAPSVTEIRIEELNFVLTDANGYQTELPKYITVSPVDLILREKTGNIMYSHLSGKFDAFNLETVEPIYSFQKDSHIKDNSIDSVNHNTLSRQWISSAGLKFVLFNGFDYANASYLLVRNSYEAGLKVSIIKDIKEDDIILTKLNNSNPDSGFIAIKIVYVIDSDSTLFDRYIFNVKK